MYNENPDSFNKNWVEFDLTGEDAFYATYDVLEAYCAKYGYANLSDLRDDFQQIIGDYDFDIRYPLGKVFALNHGVMPYKWWWKYKYKMNGRLLSIIIDIRKVNRLVGSLKYFKIYTDNCIIICGKEDLEIWQT